MARHYVENEGTIQNSTEIINFIEYSFDDGHALARDMLNYFKVNVLMYRIIGVIISCIFLSSCSFFDFIDQSYYVNFYKGESLPAIPDSEIDSDGVGTILAGICIEDIWLIDAEIFRGFKSREIGDLLTRPSRIQVDDGGGARAPILCGDFIRCLTPGARAHIASGSFPYAAYYNHLILGKDLHRYDLYDLNVAGRTYISSNLNYCTPGGTAP